MTRQELVDRLRGLTDKQLVEVFYAAVRGRDLHSGDPASESHLVLALAVAVEDEMGRRERWTLDLVGTADLAKSSEPWADDAPICQDAECCGYTVSSWAKHMVCPVCGGQVFGT